MAWIFDEVLFYLVNIVAPYSILHSHASAQMYTTNFFISSELLVSWNLVWVQKRVMNSTWFNFKDKADPIEYVVGLSDSMQVLLPPELLGSTQFD